MQRCWWCWLNQAVRGDRGDRCRPRVRLVGDVIDAADSVDVANQDALMGLRTLGLLVDADDTGDLRSPFYALLGAVTI